MDPVVLSCICQVEELDAESAPRKFTYVYREGPALGLAMAGKRAAPWVLAWHEIVWAARTIGVATRRKSCKHRKIRTPSPPPIPNTRCFSENILKVVLASPKMGGLRGSRQCGADRE